MKTRGPVLWAGPLSSDFYLRGFRPPGCPAVLRRAPESSECPHIRRIPQLLEGAFPNLADPLAGDPE